MTRHLTALGRGRRARGRGAGGRLRAGGAGGVGCRHYGGPRGRQRADLGRARLPHLARRRRDRPPLEALTGGRADASPIGPARRRRGAESRPAGRGTPRRARLPSGDDLHAIASGGPPRHRHLHVRAAHAPSACRRCPRASRCAGRWRWGWSTWTPSSRPAACRSILPPLTPALRRRPRSTSIDGLCIPGGPDIDPSALRRTTPHAHARPHRRRSSTPSSGPWSIAARRARASDPGHLSRRPDAQCRRAAARCTSICRM